MDVVLNALSLRPDGAGVSTYVRELLAAMPEHWQRRCTALVQEDAVGELPPLVGRRTVSPRDGARRALSGLRELSGSTDLVHGLDVDLPLRLRGPSVTTVHDLAVFDVPWAFPRHRALAEQVLVRRAVRRADVVVAVSHFTAGRVRARFGRECVVTPLAPGRDMLPASPEAVEAARRRHRLPERFVLHVGTVEPRKDVPRLAEACRLAGFPLVLAGGGPRVPGTVPLGFVPRADLPALYGAATVTAYVSLYEGFGLPPVEALACGARVVATRVADLPDVLGDRVTWVARDREGVVRALHEAAARQGEARPLTSTWVETARLTVDAYAQLDR